ncbi:MAG: isomerizing glutamine--fructose-6-phosphate transaminase, partial [Candidatus Nanohaloarchaeota archaeon QJJ-9]|nr:isomerizing glutamine--fructose-6-phosphate transaminase [Candidatus Nanohaloarchaeota archaeon QJJ-9]
MCGITAYIGNKNASEKLVNGLKRLEYRGYDSAGVATLKNGIEVRKDTGEIEDIDEMHNLTSMEGDIGLGHTRWATHGGVTRENAHPHTSCDGRITLVHNGIIENYEEIKSELEGHEFTSETDSEVVAHFFEEKLEEGTETREAIKKFMGKAEGTYAIVLLDSEEEKIYAIKKKSPLALGLGEGEYYIGSDIYAFSNYTDKAVFLGDDEFAVIDREGYEVYSKNGEKKEKEVKKFDWTQEEGEKEEHDHYMIKEIKEQPKVTKRLLKTFKTSQKKDLNRFLDLIEDHEKVIFTSAGTSYHASLLGVYYLQKAGVEAQALIASEFQNYERVDEDTLVIAVSQSGETMDVL